MQDNSAVNTVNEEVSPALEIMRLGMEKAINEALEDQFMSFLEDAITGQESSRNGYYERRLLTTVGPLTVKVPRDRLNVFEERIIGRYRRRIDDLDHEICRLYRQGMTPAEISEYLSTQSGVSVSEKLVLAIVQGSYGEAEKFNSRPLPKCPFVFLDGTWVPVRRKYANESDRYEKECIMVALGIDQRGRKVVLGFWLEPSESAMKWEEMLNNLKERGIGSPQMFITDGLQGMPEAIHRVFPDSMCQRCLVHVGRNMASGARTKDRFEILNDFKFVYAAKTKEEAESRLGAFVGKWAKTYPSFRKYLTTPGLFDYFSFPEPIRVSLYTSNIVEAFHACMKRKLRVRLGLHSVKSAHYLIAVECERYNRSRHNRKMTGYEDLSQDEVLRLGMER